MTDHDHYDLEQNVSHVRREYYDLERRISHLQGQVWDLERSLRREMETKIAEALDAHGEYAPHFYRDGSS